MAQGKGIAEAALTQALVKHAGRLQNKLTR